MGESFPLLGLTTDYFDRGGNMFLKKCLITVTVLAFSGLPLLAQVETRRADIRGGGGDQGKCTCEVEVDGSAEVSFSGDTGHLRTLSGQPAHWRRLDCTDSMPRNPGEFRYRGIDGRGQVELIRDPRNNRGIAVVRIEDRQSGRERYTFDLEWRGSSGKDNNRDYDKHRDWDQNENREGDGNRDKWNQRDSSRLWIVRATYGASGQTRDVTGLLRSWVRHDRLEIRADNETLRSDPAPNRRKELRVTYEDKGRSRTISVREGDLCTIP
jgi:hypothetical protein